MGTVRIAHCTSTLCCISTVDDAFIIDVDSCKSQSHERKEMTKVRSSTLVRGFLNISITQTRRKRGRRKKRRKKKRHRNQILPSRKIPCRSTVLKVCRLPLITAFSYLFPIQLAPAESYPVEPQDTPKVSKKEKKRKRKAEDAENGDAEPSLKKEKKKRRKEEGAPSPQDTSSFQSLSSSASTPSRSQSSPISALTSPKEAEEFMKKYSITIHTPESDSVPISPIVSFSQLASLPDGLKDAFKTFKEPSPIQACTWPPALAGKDVVGIAETGRYT